MLTEGQGEVKVREENFLGKRTGWKKFDKEGKYLGQTKAVIYSTGNKVIFFIDSSWS